MDAIPVQRSSRRSQPTWEDATEPNGGLPPVIPPLPAPTPVVAAPPAGPSLAEPPRRAVYASPVPLEDDDLTTEEVPLDGTLDPAPSRLVAPEATPEAAPVRVRAPSRFPWALAAVLLGAIVVLAAVAAALLASAAVIASF